MAKRKVYSDKFKASAVLMLEAAGYPDRQEALTTVSEHLVMSAKTLASWYEDTQSPDPIEPISKITEIYSEEQTASVQSDDLDWMFDDQLQFETSDNLDAPRIHERRETQRIFVNGLKKEALNKLVPILPPPGSDMYIVSNGAGAEKKWKPGGLDNEAFDFGTFIPHLVDLFAERGCIGYISTWTMNRNHALNLIEMLDDGRFAQLTVFTDPYFQRREPAVAATLIDGLMRHRQTYKAFKNHCKIVAIATADEHKTCTVVSSANLSAQPRCEQYVLTTAPDVYSFYKREFFETMLNGKN